VLSCVRAEFFLFRFEVARLSVTIRLALNPARLPKEIVFLQVLPSVCARVLFLCSRSYITESIVMTTPTAIWQVFEWFWMQAGVPPACIGLPVRHNM
jgi:hypothetical protein